MAKAGWPPGVGGPLCKAIPESRTPADQLKYFNYPLRIIATTAVYSIDILEMKSGNISLLAGNVTAHHHQI